MATITQTRSSMRSRRGRSNVRSASRRSRSRRPTRSASRRRTNLRRTSRGRTRNLPARDANGRFIRRRVRSAPRRRAGAAPRRAPVRRAGRGMPTTSVVREASRRSVAGPALVKRKWWRVDGPVDPSLPDGYAYDR